MTNANDDKEPQHPSLTEPPHDFVAKNFLVTLTGDENLDTLSQSTKKAAQYGLANLEVFELLMKVLWCFLRFIF